MTKIRMVSTGFEILAFMNFDRVVLQTQAVCRHLVGHNFVCCVRSVVSGAAHILCLNLLSFSLLIAISSNGAGQDTQIDVANDDARPLVARSARVIGDESRIRFLIEFNKEPEIAYLYLNEPYRLILDFQKTDFSFDQSSLEPRGLLTDLRYGERMDGSSRIILSMADAAVLEDRQIQVLDNNIYRLVLDISVTSDEVFSDIMAEQDWSNDSVGTKTSRVNFSGVGGSEDFVLILDAGHGGVDGGAEGQNGAVEKDITLAFVKELLDELALDENLKIILTRSDDKFLSLGARVRIARREHADLFVSVHADSIRERHLRGASVYTLSDRASDALTASLAASENRADVIEGFDIDDAPDEVTDILLDLARRETEILSNQIADQIVADFEGQVLLITNPHRRAGFRVLKAPDVPSILIELGFLSNPNDEKLLVSADWRRETARLLANSIREYQDRILSARR